jgi:hypothetical protein
MTVLVAFKTANTSRSLTETLTIDPHLQVTTAPGEVFYSFKGILITSHASTGGGDLRVGFTLPSSTSGDVYMFGGQDGGIDLSLYSAVSTSTTFIGMQSSSGGIPIFLHGRFRTSGFGAGGTFGIEWAQASSNANATIIEEGSWIKLTEVG